MVTEQENGGCGDPSPNHFTGLERDAESGSDHTLNRQYPSNLRRWVTPDPAGLIAVRFESPQTWNLYAYVGNNPLTLTDPTGLSAEVHEYCRGNTYCLASFAQKKQEEKTDEANAQDAAQSKSWWKKALSYFYYKGSNGVAKGGVGFGISGVKVGPVRVDAVAKRNVTEVKQTTDGKTVSTVSEVGAKAGVGPVKVGLDRTTVQEDGKPPVIETTLFGSIGKFEGSNAEVGIGVGGCVILCGGIEVGVRADKVLNEIKEAISDRIADSAAQGVVDQFGSPW